MPNTGYLLMSISKKLRYNLNYALTDLNITIQQWSVLQQLHHFSQTSNQVAANDLATILDMDKPTISAIIKRLAAKNLIYKTKNSHDSRAFDLFLSPAGIEIYMKAVVISDSVLSQFTNQLAATEKNNLNNILQKLDREDL
ncbi:MarR family winged helix-turn-helix transcriptional regulator [Loigolactobacillus zhaoyuanensis]|uniref:MarR family winged helix-turn-helix transcriptional regulator n=1 Tax=Loigolactobacillus zhaoyuanensis TaxID=2486017 RepID=UPI000F73C8DA|nr:MarR family transcriptional regulator [Loigolactobacillus zhaoyuanensis]